MKLIIKRVFQGLGLTIAKRDRLVELIPASYLQSPYLPRVYRQSLARILYFNEMVSRVREIDGDFVECGVSIGHGLLYFMLLAELHGKSRQFYGFDSFEGFPESTSEDRKTDNAFQVVEGDYNTPTELVMKVLRDGRASSSQVDQLRLVKGMFEDTVKRYEGRIALLHLDCDLYNSYQVCLEELYPKVVPGGLILFDEYEDADFPGAKQAIDEFLVDKAETVRAHTGIQYNKFYIIKE